MLAGKAITQSSTQYSKRYFNLTFVVFYSFSLKKAPWQSNMHWENMQWCSPGGSVVGVVCGAAFAIDVWGAAVAIDVWGAAVAIDVWGAAVVVGLSSAAVCNHWHA